MKFMGGGTAGTRRDWRCNLVLHEAPRSTRPGVYPLFERSKKLDPARDLKSYSDLTNRQNKMQTSEDKNCIKLEDDDWTGDMEIDLSRLLKKWSSSSFPMER